jgi:hypothetical protein
VAGKGVTGAFFGCVANKGVGGLGEVIHALYYHTSYFISREKCMEGKELRH